MKIVYLKLEPEEPFRANPSQVRGFFAKEFPDKNLLHQYDKGGKPLYRYPRIQYKVDPQGRPFIFAIKEGVELILEIYDQIEQIEIGDRIYNIIGRELTLRDNQELSSSDEFYSYKFDSPWLPLNQENFERYNRINRLKQQELLSNILVGNILSMCKGLNHWVDERIEVEISVSPREIKALHFQDMLGFKGTFKVNFYLPEYIGIGRQVSKGFGTVRKLTNKH